MATRANLFFSVYIIAHERGEEVTHFVVEGAIHAVLLSAENISLHEYVVSTYRRIEIHHTHIPNVTP